MKLFFSAQTVTQKLLLVAMSILLLLSLLYLLFIAQLLFAPNTYQGETPQAVPSTQVIPERDYSQLQSWAPFGQLQETLTPDSSGAIIHAIFYAKEQSKAHALVEMDQQVLILEVGELLPNGDVVVEIQPLFIVTEDKASQRRKLALPEHLLQLQPAQQELH